MRPSPDSSGVKKTVADQTAEIERLKSGASSSGTSAPVIVIRHVKGGGVSSGDDAGEGPSSLPPGVSPSVPSVSSAVAPPPSTESFLAPSPAVGSSFPPSGPSGSSGVKRARDDGDSVVVGEGPVSKKGKGSLSLVKGRA